MLMCYRLTCNCVFSHRNKAAKAMHSSCMLAVLSCVQRFLAQCTMQNLMHQRLVPRDEAAKTMQSSYTLAISARSRQLAAGRCAPGEYRNHGERMYVEGVMEQRRKEQLVRERRTVHIFRQHLE